MAYINTKRSYTSTGVKDWIPLNRWTDDDYSLVISGDGTVTVEGTIAQPNRFINGAGEALTSDDVFDVVNGTGLTPVTGTPVTLNIESTPLEALRLNIAAGTNISVRVMQNGQGLS